MYHRQQGIALPSRVKPLFRQANPPEQRLVLNLIIPADTVKERTDVSFNEIYADPSNR